MTTQSAGEHHTGTLNLTGEGNKPEQPSYIDQLAHAAIVAAGNTLLAGNRGAQIRAAVDATEPLIRQQVAEEIATVAEEYADDLDMPTTVDWLELRGWFKGQLHVVAAKAREIGDRRS